MNERAVVDAIKTARKGDATQLDAAHYLEKICMNIWRLPGVATPLNSFFEWVGEGLGKSKSDIVVDASSREDQTMLGAIERSMPPNPRRIKALANVVRRALSNNPATGPMDWRSFGSLVCVSYVYQFHGPMFSSWRHSLAFANEIIRFCFEGGRGYPEAEIEKLGFSRVFADLTPTSSGGTSAGPTVFPNPDSIETFWISAAFQVLRETFNIEPRDFEVAFRLVD